MIFVSDAVIDDRAVMIKSFNTPHTSHAVDRALGPNASAEETEIVKIPILLKSFVQMLIELSHWNRFGVPRISAES